MSVNPVFVSTQTLDLTGDGTASFTTTAPVDLVRVDVSGVDAGASAVVNVDGTDVATIALTDGAGQARTAGVRTAVVAKADGTYKHQDNQTDAGYENVISASVPNQKPVANNIASGKVVKVTVAGAAAGSAVLTFDVQGAQAAATNFGSANNGINHAVGTVQV